MSRQIVAYFMSSTGFLVRSDGKWTNKTNEYFPLLVENIPNSIKIFTHLNYNVAALLKALGITEAEGKELLEYKKIIFPPYVLEYVPNRYFSLKNDRSFCFIANADQYKKLEFEDAFKLEDCFEVAKATRKVGEEVQTALELIGCQPKSLSSPVGSYERDSGIFNNVPNINDIPDEAGRLAFDCVDGSWIEGFNIGHYGAYDYDITSAYGGQLSKLKDLRDGKWVKTYGKIPEAYYGFYKVKVNIKSQFSPVFYRTEKDGDMESYTPTGTWEKSLTLQKLHYLDWVGRDSYKIDYGWVWIPNDVVRYPFNEAIMKLETEKNFATGMNRRIIKRTMAGLWGKLLQVKDENFIKPNENETFNPVYGAIVEDNVKLQVASYAIVNNTVPLHIAVDGAIFNKPMPTDNPRMGKWRLEKIGKVFILGTAQVAFQGKEDDEERDFSLRYDWLEKEIEKSPSSTSYEMKKKSPYTLAYSINKNEFSKLGTIQTITKMVNIGGDHKRMYQNRPKNGKEMYGNYNSIPLDAGVIK